MTHWLTLDDWDSEHPGNVLASAGLTVEQAAEILRRNVLELFPPVSCGDRGLVWREP